VAEVEKRGCPEKGSEQCSDVMCVEVGQWWGRWLGMVQWQIRYGSLIVLEEIVRVKVGIHGSQHN
jgi:hypothetical protein